MRPRFPDSSYNLVSLLGLGIALFALAAIIILYVMDSLGGHANPYLGIFILFLFPSVLVLGLLLIPLGMWRERRRRKRGAREPFVVDLGRPQHRNALVVFVAGTCVFLLLTTVGMYEGYELMESNEFCGDVCHTAMEPEGTTHPLGAHAQVKCVSCHIHPGPDWYLKAKLNGARQMWEYMRDTYHRPIPTPIETLPPTDVVCKTCHWPAKEFHYPAEQFDYFLGDEENTHWQIKMVKKVGGPGIKAPEEKGSHWHLSQEISYISSDDKRQTMDLVRWRDGTRERVYTKGGRGLDGSEHHRERDMQCLDCHNRPAHEFPTPMELMNRALASGAIDRAIPWIKREGVKALSKSYESLEQARSGIQSDLRKFYSQDRAALSPSVADTLHAIYSKYNFPRMQARWDTYPSHNGHFSFDGCFRCHGSDLETPEGERISADCNQCHLIVDQGPGDLSSGAVSISGLSFKHPVDIADPQWELKCTECHIGDGAVYLPDSLVQD